MYIVLYIDTLVLLFIDVFTHCNIQYVYFKMNVFLQLHSLFTTSAIFINCLILHAYFISSTCISLNA